MARQTQKTPRRILYLVMLAALAGFTMQAVQGQAQTDAPAATTTKKPVKKLWAGKTQTDAQQAPPESTAGAGTGAKKLWKTKPATPKLLFKETFDAGASPDWKLMRMQFGLEKGTLKVFSAPRTGFDYGQDKQGRRAAAFAHIGDTGWTNYRVEMDVYGGGVGAFNPHAMDSCMRGGFSVYFRTIDYKEKWTEPARSAYSLSLNPMPLLCDGQAAPDSGLFRTNNWYKPQRTGPCVNVTKEAFTPAAGISKAVAANVEPLWQELILKGYIDATGKVLEPFAKVQGAAKMNLSAAYKKDAAAIHALLLANYCAPSGGSKELKKIDGMVWRIDEPNHVIIEVRGTGIAAAVNGVNVLQYVDTSPDALLYGGIGVEWAWENTGWVDNVVVTKL